VNNKLMVNVVALLSGLLFGFGLSLSEMVNPNRILGFLDLFGDWDPTLLFVMAGAVPVSALSYFLIRGKDRPAFAERFNISIRKEIDRKLIVGSAIFGVGWGIAGYCPGPVVTMLSLQLREPLIFLVAMLVGSLAYRQVSQAKTGQ
jgi:uncharacterized membrane protein YedE/YeeE